MITDARLLSESLGLALPEHGQWRNKQVGVGLYSLHAILSSALHSFCINVYTNVYTRTPPRSVHKVTKDDISWWSCSRVKRYNGFAAGVSGSTLFNGDRPNTSCRVNDRWASYRHRGQWCIHTECAGKNEWHPMHMLAQIDNATQEAIVNDGVFFRLQCMCILERKPIIECCNLCKLVYTCKPRVVYSTLLYKSCVAYRWVDFIFLKGVHRTTAKWIQKYICQLSYGCKKFSHIPSRLYQT